MMEELSWHWKQLTVHLYPKTEIMLITLIFYAEDPADQNEWLSFITAIGEFYQYVIQHGI